MSVTVRELAKALSRVRGERRNKKIVFQGAPDGGFEPLIEYRDIVAVKEHGDVVALLDRLPPEPEVKEE